MKDNKELQTKYLQFQLFEQQIKELQNQMQALEKQIMEAKLVQQSVDDFKTAEEGSDILIPLSNGIFAKAELKNNKDLLVNVGANTVVKKTVKETKELLEKQVNEIRKVQQQLAENLQKFDMQMVNLEKEITHLMEEAKK